MKSLIFIVSAMTAMFLRSSAPAMSSDRQCRIKDEVCRLESDFDRAIIARDDKFLADLLADEYQHTNFIGGTTDKKAELAFFASPDFVLKKASIDSCDVRVYHDIAIATGVNIWTQVTYRTRDLSGLYRFTTVYRLRKGRWQIVVSHASKIASAS